MQQRETNFGKCNFVPASSIEDLYPGTFYLEKCDDKWKRYYHIKGDERKFDWTGDLVP